MPAQPGKYDDARGWHCCPMTIPEVIEIFEFTSRTYLWIVYNF